jgi:hypothetical protein
MNSMITISYGIRKETVMKTESKKPEKLEWSAPELKELAVDATESGAAEFEEETEFTFLVS